MLIPIWRGIEIALRCNHYPFVIGKADKLGNLYACFYIPEPEGIIPIPKTIYPPLGEKAKEKNQSVCPSNVLISMPVSISQSVKVLSPFPDTIYLPSGEKAKEETCPSCLLNVLISLPIFLHPRA